MWVSINNKWGVEVKPLERFLTERIIQRCDYEEIISNIHRTTNGFVQTKELIKLAELSLNKDKTVRTLIVLFEEAKSQKFSQNISNDFIINSYFKDIKDYIQEFDIKTLKTKENTANPITIKVLIHKLRIFDYQLESFYFKQIIREFGFINFSETENFERNADKISSLIDLLIPYLLFKGYSVSSLNEVLLKFKGGYRPTIGRFFEYFNFKEREFDFILNLGEDKSEANQIMFLFQENYNFLVKDFPLKYFPQKLASKNGISDKSILVQFTTKTIDPHSFIRSSYDRLIKMFVIKKDRPSLSYFNEYFERCFWRYSGKGSYIYSISLEFDPINVKARKSTFRKTLICYGNSLKINFNEDEEFNIPKNSTLEKAMYYYNLALGSKSIENSLSLLWTSLETILPYRVTSSDIECVQHFVSKSLSIGSISRDIYSYGSRFNTTNKENGYAFSKINENNFEKIITTKGLTNIFQWLIKTENLKEKTLTLKASSELLTFQFSKMGKKLALGKLKELHVRLESSEESIKYQLQRIYLHRNQIIHSGDLVNEYTNLWLHLEWYVGKLIAYGYFSLEILGLDKSLADVFRELEADYNYLKSYLEKNPDTKISDSSRVYELMFKHSWQSF